jgi:SAM-dependent methyltransferase
MATPRTWIFQHLLAPPLTRAQRPLLAAAPTRGRALDLGCGTGELALALAQRGLEVTGVDLDEHKLAVARAAVGERAELRLGDARALPFEDDSFAVATASMLLHGIDHEARRAVVGEALRVAERLLVMDYAVPLTRRPVGPLLRAIERASPPEHHAGFRDFLRRGGMPGLVGELGLSAQLIASPFSGGLGVWWVE